MEYKLNENETQDEFIYRVCSDKDLIGTWEEVAIILNKELEQDFGESAYRKKYQSYLKIFDKIKDKFDVNCNEEAINEKLLKTKVAQIKARDLNSFVNQKAREMSRFEQECEAIENGLKGFKRPTVPPIKIVSRKKKEGLLAFGDSHYGKDMIIKGLYGETLNEYNPQVFEERMWKLRDETIEIVNKENLDKITIFDLGDAIEGMLRVSALQTLKYGAIDSAIMYAGFISTWLNDLSKHVSIDYYSVEGNHDDTRILTGKKGDFPHENLGRVINRIISADLSENRNVDVKETLNPKIIFTNIAGYDIMATHGEEKNKETSIREYEDIYNVKINYLLGGHLHHTQNKEVGFDKEYIGCGSIIGIDDYSVNLKKVARPSAKFLILEQNKGKIEYTIDLK